MVDRDTRVLEHRKRAEVVIQQQHPSILDMREGEELFVQAGGNLPRKYYKILGQLYYVELTKV